ncbi:MAG: hypothetical protein ACREQW_03385 [Candidatus Binatia bacterium]
MVGQCVTQRNWGSVVKENSHACLAGDPRSRHSQTAFRVAEDKLHLFTRHAGEPRQKIINSRAVFEVLEQRLDRHTCAFEQPFTANLSRDAFDGRTLAPIEHEAILRDAPLARKAGHVNRISALVEKSLSAGRSHPLTSEEPKGVKPAEPVSDVRQRSVFGDSRFHTTNMYKHSRA